MNLHAVVRYEANVAASEDVVNRYPIHLLEGLKFAVDPPPPPPTTTTQAAAGAAPRRAEKPVTEVAAVLSASPWPQHLARSIKLPHSPSLHPPDWGDGGWSATFVPLRLQIVGVSRWVRVAWTAGWPPPALTGASGVPWPQRRCC